MSAPPVVGALIETFTSILADKVLEEVSLITGFKNDFEFLCDELVSVKLLLDEAGQNSTSRSMSNWLEKLEYFLIDALDIVDECRASKFGKSIFSNFEKHIFRYKMGSRMRTLRERINNIHRSAKYLKHLMSVLQVNALNAHNLEDRRERSSALLKETHIVGIEEDIKNVTELILEEKGPQVIAVVGMGGRGKTLLVDRVVNSRKVHESFDHVVWQEVPQNFDMQDMLHQIKKKMKLLRAQNQNVITEDAVGYPIPTMDDSRGQILEELERRRCLLVLDDIWNRNDFNQFNWLLSKAKIVLTTRDEGVLSTLSPDLLKVYNLKKLCDENSKKLFCIHAFPDRGDTQQCPADTDQPPKDFTQQCPADRVGIWEKYHPSKMTVSTIYTHVLQVALFFMTVSKKCRQYLTGKMVHDGHFARQIPALPADTDQPPKDFTQQCPADTDQPPKDLTQHSTANTDIEPPKELVAFADQIVQKCGGLPLALKTIGASMARVRRLPNDWESILKSLNEEEAMSGKVWASLRLSYEALPYHLKLCFDYCSCFPKNRRIKSEYLVNAWIDEGFIPRTAEYPYDVGLSYIKELIDRCLLEVSKVGGDGRVRYCKMHELFYDIAYSESHKKTKCLLNPGKEFTKFPEGVSGLRRISLIGNENNISTNMPTVNCPGLRTLLLSNNASLESISTSFFDDMKYVAVLDLSGTSITSLPETIRHLKHLKLLNLSGTKIAKLPKSLAELRSLHFLDVSQCKLLREMHSGIGEHRSMLHLNVKGSGKLESLPVGISKLVHLHTLKGPVFKMAKVPTGKALQWSAVLKRGKPANANILQWWDLKSLTLLQHLSLMLNAPSSEGIIRLEEGTFASMINMRVLSFKYLDSSAGSCGILHLPKDIEVMRRLEILHLRSCALQDWIFRLENLMELELYGDNGSSYTGLEKIPNLRKLKLSSNDNYVQFPSDDFEKSGAFPKLENFVIKHFSKLENFPSLQDGALPRLKCLQMKHCDRLKDITKALQRPSILLEEIRVKGCREWQKGIWKDEGTWQLLEDHPIKLTIDGYTISWALDQSHNSKLFTDGLQRKSLRSAILMVKAAAIIKEAGTSSAGSVAVHRTLPNALSVESRQQHRTMDEHKEKSIEGVTGITQGEPVSSSNRDEIPNKVNFQA